MALTNKFRLLNIQDHSLDPLASQHLDNLRSNPITTTSNRDNLPTPIIPIVHPVVRDPVIKEALDTVEEAAEDEAAKPFQSFGVVGEELGAFCCVERGEVDGEGFARVEDRVFEEGEDSVEGETCASRCC
jgi:hypothetical protein